MSYKVKSQPNDCNKAYNHYGNYSFRRHYYDKDFIKILYEDYKKQRVFGIRYSLYR